MHPIIPEYLEKGLITKEAAKRLEAFEGQIKEAGFIDTLKKAWNVFRDEGPGLLQSTVIPILSTGATLGISRYFDHKKEQEELEKQRSFLNNSFYRVKEKLHTKDEAKLKQRFEEVAFISPTLAQNPSIAAKIISRTYNKGLNEEDMSKLVQIEANATQIKHAPKPVSITGQILSAQVPGMVEMLKHVSKSVDHQKNLDLSQTNNRLSEDSFEVLSHKGKQDMANVTAQEQMNYMATPERFADRVKAAVQKGIKIPSDILKIDLNDTKEQLNVSQHVQRIGSKIYPEVKEIHDARLAAAKQAAQATKTASILLNSDVLTKQAFALPKGFLQGIASAAAIGLVSGGVHHVADVFARKKHTEKVLDSWEETSRNLKKMTDEGSSNAEGLDFKNKKTQDIAKKTFNTLLTVAPDLATNADIATSYITKTMRAGNELDFGSVKAISDIQKNIDNSSGIKSPLSTSALSKGFSSGFQAAGGGSQVARLSDIGMGEDEKIDLAHDNKKTIGSVEKSVKSITRALKKEREIRKKDREIDRQRQVIQLDKAYKASKRFNQNLKKMITGNRNRP